MSKNFTFEELSHYSRSRINPYTIELVHALCSQFTISARAKKDLAAVSEKLSGTPDKSIRHVLLDLTASDPGLIALSICGIINKTFQQDSLGVVFGVLASSSAMPDDLRPPEDSWAELNELAGQLQLPDIFHALVEKYSQLEKSTAEAPEKTQCVSLENAGPHFVVDGLQAMSRLCSGDDPTTLLMLAGHHAGWYAAVAEWISELKTQIAVKAMKSYCR